MKQRVLVLGAAGRFGRHAVKAFRAGGRTVRVFLRPGRTAPDDCETVFGDLSAIAGAADGVDVIVNGLNPPDHHWARDLPRQTTAIIEAAQASGATVIIPGNVYNFGAGLPPVLHEGTPHRADHRKARLRIEMERAYHEAGIRTIILRAGDYIDDRVTGNWFDGHIAGRVGQGRFTYPGPMNLDHAWAWLPDVARAAVLLAERRADLDRFQTVGFPGYTLTGQDLMTDVEAITKRPLRLRRFPWWMVSLLAPFSPLLREVRAMRYLWTRPHRIDGTAFGTLLPEFEATPRTQALRQALEGYARHAG